jgi:hypothetical protein
MNPKSEAEGQSEHLVLVMFCATVCFFAMMLGSGIASLLPGIDKSKALLGVATYCVACAVCALTGFILNRSIEKKRKAESIG